MKVQVNFLNFWKSVCLQSPPFLLDLVVFENVKAFCILHWVPQIGNPLRPLITINGIGHLIESGKFSKCLRYGQQIWSIIAVIYLVQIVWNDAGYLISVLGIEGYKSNTDKQFLYADSEEVHTTLLL